MAHFSSPGQRRNLLFFGVHYIIYLLIFLVFVRQSPFGSSFLQGLWVSLSYLTYPVIYLLPGFVVTALLFCPGKRWTNALAIGIAILWTFLSEFLLAIDAAILIRFGYHINGLVLNLLLTPGGFEAMGLDSATLAPAIGMTCAAFAIAVSFGILCHRWKKLQNLADKLFQGHRRALLWGAGAYLAAFLGSLVIVAFADFYSIKGVLMSTYDYPKAFTMRMRKFLRKIGCQEPDREKMIFDDMADAAYALNYPAVPIRREKTAPPYNILWLTGESLRADLLNPEVMPNAWGLSQKGILCQRHYSGGHGTRPAMFSMFYALYGNNWNSFLNCRRCPIFFDWLKEDGYQFLVQTSAKFTYPEFDQTIFASIPTKDMIEQKDKAPWRRDVMAADRLVEFLKARKPGDPPFFAFHFFEATHAPYTFDETQALRSDYAGDINYATVSPKDARGLYNRQANAANGMDRQIGRVLEALESIPGLAEQTIVVITGDHGEEFFEKGRLGHNSTFVEEQIRPPLTIYIPGVEHTEIDHPTHHTDIIPTLAPFLGVQNPPEDYCVGESILDPQYDRTYYIVCGWDIDTFVNAEFKYIIPTGAGTKYYGRNLFTANDQPVEDDQPFLRKYSRELLDANHQMMRFLKKGK